LALGFLIVVVSGRVSELVPPPERTLPTVLERQAQRWGDRTLLRAGTEVRSFAGMRDAVARQAGALAAAGIERGDRVAALSENRIELLDLWLGCAWLGAVLVPVNTGLRGGQLEHVLANSGAKALAAEPTLVDRLESVETRPPLVWELGATLPTGGEPVEAAPVRPGDPAAILYTSGTTGPSKGVVCPQAQWYWWAVSTGRVLALDEDDVLHTTLPLFHTNALNAFCQALVSGATYVLAPRFSASAFWQRVHDEGATVTYLLGAMVSILLKRPPSNLDRSHRVRVALAPATPAELHAPFLERFGVRLVDAWGSTETNIVLANTLDDVRPGTIGRVVAGYEARVVDEDDAEVPDGTPGELVVRHSEPFSFATGYFGLPEQTVDAWRNLWFHTGDRVVRDPDGSFRFVDRIKDVIRRRGENVSSHEVEQVLLAHPEVAAAAVFPVPSELGEDEVMACVVPRPGAALDPLDLVRFCEPRLAYFAVPRYLEVVTELPLTATGKVEKFRLRERGVTAAAWDRDRAGYEVRR
jgi:crotonobetaine/carnitine-CoA ligase